MEDETAEWAGVFICSDEDEVERAFAISEPPAHDDWIPTFHVPRSRSRSYVKVALERIKQRISNPGGDPDTPINPGGAGKLAATADKMGKFIAGVQGDRIGTAGGGRTGGGAGKGRGKKVRASRPVFERLEKTDDGDISVFSLDVEVPDGRRAMSRTARIILEGGSKSDTAAPNGQNTRFISWENEQGHISQSDEVEVSSDTKLTARISVPDYVAVTLTTSNELGD